MDRWSAFYDKVGSLSIKIKFVSKMKTFINDDFLLQSDFAKTLYHNYAKELPIIDYHNHLPPQEIDGNRVFENISQAWLAGDHYNRKCYG